VSARDKILMGGPFNFLANALIPRVIITSAFIRKRIITRSWTWRAAHYYFVVANLMQVVRVVVRVDLLQMKWVTCPRCSSSF
jgi:hypothetical protein